MEPDDAGDAADKGKGRIIENDSEITFPYMMLPQNNAQVMTEEQLETLRKQISVYSTICSQLVEMHKVMSQQASPSPEHMLFDPGAAGPEFRPSARQRWTPSQTQLVILESLYESGNGTPNKQKIKEITNELSQHGPISETNVYNWFQNRKARAKRKQQLLPQKEGESEVDTDGESSREKKPKVEGDLKKEDASAGFNEKTAKLNERNHGRFYMVSERDEEKSPIYVRHNKTLKIGLEQADTDAQTLENKYDVVRMKPQSTKHEQFIDSQDDISSPWLVFQTHAEPEADALLERSGSVANTCNAFETSVSNLQESGVMTVLLDGKQWEVPTGVVDIRRTFGENAMLLDSHGQVVPTNDAGVTFHPLHASESYTLVRHGEGKRGISMKSSSDLLPDNFHHIPGILNEG